MTTVDVTELIAEHFPLGALPVQLHLGAPYPISDHGDDSDGEPRAVATVQLVVWDGGGDGGGQPSIRDIKEQQLYMGWPAWYRDRERVAAFFAALGALLGEIPIDVVERLMPHELVLAEALGLKRPRSREDFDAALRAKSRLGKFLSSPTAG